MQEIGESDYEANVSRRSDTEPKCQKCNKSYTRADSGRGKSLTSSADLSDDEIVDSGAYPQTCSPNSSNASDNSPFIDNGDLHNIIPGVENSVMGGDYRSTREDVVSGVHRLAKKLDRQMSFDVSQDTDPSNILKQSPSLNPRSLENHQIMTPSEHSLSDIGSPAVSAQSNEESRGRNESINNSLTCSALHSNSHGLLFSGGQRPIASSHIIQKRFYENLDTSDVLANSNVQHVSSQIPLPVPAVSLPVYADPRFVSHPISPQGLVPKEIMDQLGKELTRERWKVGNLQLENKKLHLRVRDLEKRHIMDIVIIQQQFVQFEEKESELKGKEQEIESLQKCFNKLECEVKDLNMKILKEQENTQDKEDTLTNLRLVLRNEKDKFRRDETSLKEQIENLKQENQTLEQVNQFLREEPTPYEYPPSCVVREEIGSENNPQRQNRNSLNNNYSLDPSAETSIKEVYHENTTEYQKHNTRLKQRSHESSDNNVDSDVSQLKASGSKQISPRSSGVDRSIEICSNCYRVSSEFTSHEHFQKHKDKCRS